MPPPSEAELDQALERLADGDRSAFSVVFSMLSPLLERYCTRLLDNRADGEDAAQRTLEKVFSHVSYYEKGRSGAAWAFGIAYWECRTQRKRRQRAREQELEVTLVDTDGSPEELVLDREVELALKLALEQLPSTDREVFAELLSAELHDGPRSSSFRKRKQRALSRLQALWSTLYGS